jgi:hypothetical protein
MAFLLMLACDSQKAKNPKSSIDTQIVKNDTVEENVKEFLELNEVEFDGYKFKYGYEKYNEDSFGFSNPGRLEVLKNERVIFKDSFNGEGELYMKSLGHHDISGNKVFFTLNWGTEACDYAQHSRYYYITPESKVNFVNEYWAMTGGDGYASRYYEHIFPEDSNGAIDSLIILEGIQYHEHDQQDLSDTSYIFFDADKFTISKPTNNLNHAK